MVRLKISVIAVTLCAAVVLGGGSCSAQGLIFHLPEDGKSVEYEGILTQSTGPDDQAALSWTCELSIKSVGAEEAEFEGTKQMCRWIEIKTLTGKSSAAGIDPGPVGARIYKVLVPESKVIAGQTDADGIPNAMLPIVKGFRRLGEEAVKEIKTPALRTYPTITLLTNYQQLEEIASADVPEVILQGLNITARRMKGTTRMERTESRSTNEGEYWVSDSVPFGLARWIVTVTREEKPSAAPVAEFKPVNIVKIDMKLKNIRDNAESELVTQ